MNKKFSTLLTVGLLATGSLFSSAYADKLSNYMEKEPAAEVTNGSTYFLVEKHEAPDLTGSGYIALGMNWGDPNNEVVSIAPLFVNYDTSFDPNAYLWVVSESTVLGKTTVTFKNKLTGKSLRVSKDGTALIEDYKADAAADANADNSWAWAGWKSYKDAKSSNNTHLYPAYATEHATGAFNNVLWIDGASPYSVNVNANHSTNANTQFLLYAYKDETVADDELNELYNTQGFNLKLDDKYKGIENLLADKRLRAIDVDKFIQVGSDAKFGFPAGTYFVTETPDKAYDGTAAYLLNCTFIAMSSTENVSTKADKQNNGEGFQLVEVAGKDLNLMKAGLLPTELAEIVASKKPCGSDINVNNAAFEVKTNSVKNAGKYSLALPNMFYKKTTDNATNMQSKTAVVLSVKSDQSYSSNQALVSFPSTTPEFIFEFVESNVKKGTDFISKDGKSVYNIYFPAIESYLSSQMTKDGYKNYAVGPVMAETEIPAFQYVVTKVDNNNVTFTNRASQESFTVQLFDEDDDVYSLAEKTTTTFTALDIKNNGNVEEKEDWINRKLSGQFIKLLPVETEEISGYDVEDGTQITLTFARDNDPTSNKMYPVVNATMSGYEFENVLTDEVAEAAQWQLAKAEKASYKTLTYAYLDANEKIAYKTKGDTVAYYTYKLQLVKDGNAVAGCYLKYASNSDKKYSISTTKTESGILDLMIKENVDGSAILTVNGKYFLSVDKNATAPETTIKKELDRFVKANEISATSKATDIKTYLVQEAPEVSLPATATYVTLKSEMGNYISMNNEKDGIVVSNEELTFRVFATDLKAVVPSFFITTGWNGDDASRDLLFNPEDSVNYYVGTGKYDKNYQWSEETKKAIFKNGILNETVDTLTTAIKGKVSEVAMNADNKGTKGGLNRFKFQIVLAEDSEDLYVIRQLNASANRKAQYLSNVNDKLTWDENKGKALKFAIADTKAPTANEAVAASEISVVATNGAVIVKGAAGKKVAISNILGQTIANTVVASDNATIAAPAGIVVVAVEGEDAVKVVVK